MNTSFKIVSLKLFWPSNIANYSTKTAFTYSSVPKILKEMSTKSSSKSRMSNVRGCVPSANGESKNEAALQTFAKLNDFRSRATCNI